MTRQTTPRTMWTAVFATAMIGITVAMAAPALAVTPSQRAEQVRYATETVSLGNYQFMQRKADFLTTGCAIVAGCQKPIPYNAFDWSTDGCSQTPSSLKALFDPACQQHDFGYRNFGKGLTLGRTETTRAWIDDRFRTEMKSICNYRFPTWMQYANLQTCFKEADIMYAAVRIASSWA